MKTIRYILLFVLLCFFTACTSNNLSSNNADINNNNNINNMDNGDDPTMSNSGDSESIQPTVTIQVLDISLSDDTIPADVEEMLVYDHFSGIDQIINKSDVIDFGMNDGEINDYGLWHDSVNRVFCGFEEQFTGSIKGILTSPDGNQEFFNTSMEFNQLGNEEYCIGFNLAGLVSGGPYEFDLEIPELVVNDVFNIYVNTLIIRNWEPNESIRILIYSHEASMSPTGNFHNETYLNADENGELWIEIVDNSSNSMWENDLIAVVMIGESGKTAKLFGETDYSNIEEKAEFPGED